MFFPIALQLFSVREELKADFYGTLDKVKEMGYDGVEFFTLFDERAEEVKAHLDKIGLKGMSAHIALDDLIDKTDEMLSAYKLIGCKYIAVPYLPEDRRPGTEGFIKTIEQIKEIAKKAKDKGLTLLYHNHDFEFQKIEGEYALDMLYRLIPAELLQTEIDTCWVNVGGEDPTQYLLKYSGRAPVVHLKDFVMSGKEKPKKLYDLIGIDDDTEAASEEVFAFRPVGRGVQDFPSIIAAAEKAGAAWIVVEQDNPDTGNTALNAAKQSIDYLRSL